MAQIKDELAKVVDLKSGYEFLSRYGTLNSVDGKIAISIEQLMGLARTVALADKLLELKPKEFIKADKYFVKHTTTEKRIAINWETLKLSRPCQQESLKIKAFQAQYGQADHLDKYFEWLELCSQEERETEMQTKEHRPPGDKYLTFVNGPDHLVQFVPLLPMSRIRLANDEYLTDYFVTNASTKKKAAMITLAHVIERMGTSLIQKIEVDSNGHFFQTYEATDWWSSIALHFRGRLLGSIMKPCLDCGKELINTNPDISPKNTRKYCDDTCSKRYRRRKKAQEA